jgi:uncharacterized protein YbjT (DUF2867 family)
MAEILVTGGTGSLGRPTVARLRAAHHVVRILTRGPGTPADQVQSGEAQPAGAFADAVRVDGATHDADQSDRTFPDLAHLSRGHLVHGDLLTGDGIDAAVDGVDTVIHLATSNGSRDVAMAERLIRASEKAGVRHFIHISIVGIDQIPLGFYRAKLEVESLVEQSSIAHTIVRATQFHSFVVRLFTAQRWSPVVFVPRFSIQPISVDDVALRLVEIAEGDAAGRVPDIGGPEQRTARALARAWAKAAGVKRPIMPVSLAGSTYGGFAAGHNLVAGPPYGTTTFENYLATRYNGTAL